MIESFVDIHNKLEEIRTYLIKIGPTRRKGDIIVRKYNEAKLLSEKYNNFVEEVNQLEKLGKITEADSLEISQYCLKITEIYERILSLCSVKEEENSNNTEMASFDLKVALSLLPLMNDQESNTKQLIDGIEYYSTVLTKAECKLNLINFVLKSRLSQSAKLRLNSSYDNIETLLQDMRTHLLPKKAATAIQDKLTTLRQNELSINDYGQEIAKLFVDLTISQANGKTEDFKVLKPLNEKMAIKKFADGLRNRRLSTIISARNYDNLKDAIQAAVDEDTSGQSTSGEVLSMRGSNRSAARGGFHNYRIQGRGVYHMRGNFRGRTQRGTWYNSNNGNFNGRFQSQRGPHRQYRGVVRGTNTRGRSTGMYNPQYQQCNRWKRPPHNIQFMTPDGTLEREGPEQTSENYELNDFFRD